MKFTIIALLAAGIPMIQAAKPRNYIFFLPDGYGPASEVFARDYANAINNATVKLPVDDLAIGYVRTKASDTLVTDSAAAATAYAAGIKTYNGAIGVDDDYQPVGTILEAAKLAGFHTGLVVTSRITHASPAGFATHIWDRDEESTIASQLTGYAHPLGNVVDIMMGGGRCFFLPNSDPDSCRDDDLDLWSVAQSKLNWTMTSSREAFDNLRNGETPASLPFAFLPNLDHMMYEADRDAQLEPSLTEMVGTTLPWLTELTKDTEKGYFLFVEASRIDHAGHAHDPIGHLYDILEYNRAMLSIKQWIDDHPDTVLLSGADHECGGLTLGVPDYAWYPEVLSTAKYTSGYYADIYAEIAAQNLTTSELKAAVTTKVFEPYGIVNGTSEEIAGLSEASDAAIYLGELLSARAGINWSTLGHTAVDITLFGYGMNVDELVGSHENSEVGLFMAAQLGLNLNNVTKKLVSNTTFVNAIAPPSEEARLRKRYEAEHEHELMHAGIHMH